MVDEELDRLLSDGVTQDELDLVRVSWEARFIRGLESIGGFYGIVQSVKDDRVVLKIAEGTKVEVQKSSIQACLNMDGDNK